MTRSITFVVEGDVDTEITVTENADGTLTFDITVLGSGMIGDLRAVYFDLNGLTVDAAGFSVYGSDVTASEYAEEGVDTLGRDTNINGSVSNELGDFDVGIEFGTSGSSNDDIQSTSFTLAYDPDGDGMSELSLDMLDLSDFGLRYTSVGDADGDRTGSLKISDQSNGVAQNDLLATHEESSATINVLADDTNGAVLQVAGIRLSGTDVFVSLPADGFDLVHDGLVVASVMVAADGTTTINAVGKPGADLLAAGQVREFQFQYRSKAVDGSLATATVTVTITGTNDDVLVSGAVATGAVEEDVTAQATGTVDFTDVDLTDVHLVTSAAVSSDYAVPLGTFTAVKTADTTGSGTGGVASWTYDIDQAAAQQLAAGQVVTEVHRITIDDQQGDTVTQDVTVTIAGTNDDVLVSGAVATGAVEEDVTAQATGTVDFTDVDLTDVHLVTSAAVSSDYAVPLGTFTAVKTADTTGSGTGGVASWTYDIDQAAAQQLAAGQVVTEVHRITIDDQQGDTVTQDVTVTIAGTNDDVLVSGAVATGAVEEDVTAQATGTVDFTDVDLTDVHLVTSAAVSSDYAVPLGTFTAVKTADTTGSGTGGVASWTYDIDQAAAQQLAAGQVVTEVHRITIDDQQGDTVTQDVTVTIAGTNDDVLVSGAVATGAVEEDVTAQATGTVDFTDVDLTDVHLVTSAAVSSDYAVPLGTFTAVKTADTTGSGTGGVASWTYDIDQAAAQQLAAGQVVTEVHRITIDDQQGDTVTQDVTVTIAGTNDDVLVSGAVATGAVEEDVTAQATGTVDFTDVDLTDVHLVTSAAVSSDYAVPLGTFTAVKTADTTGSGTGGVASWTYDIDQAAAQQLAAGQVVTEVHRITIDDQQGDTVTQDVTVTIAGTNDDVLVSGAVATGAVEEDVTAQATGTVDFTDVDLTDVHLVTSAAVSSDYAVPLGTFTAVKTADTTGSGTGGVASWTYDIDQAAAQQLAAGQVVTEVHRITIDDQQGDTVTQDVTVTIAGTNDDVLVSGAVATGAVEEDVTAQATGTVDFTDVDLTDVHLVTSAAVSSDYAVPLGTFTAVKTADTTGSGTGGVASWTYDIDQAAAQQLAARQVVTEVHRITIDDQQGDTVTQDVTVTIAGTNDDVLVSGAVATGAVEEDVTAQATGTVDFTDVDLTDVHLVTSAAVSSDYAVPLGTFTAVKTADTTGSGTGGVASWTYDIDQAAAQQLAARQVVTEVHRITIDDQQGDTVTQDVTVTIAGTNDDVLVSGAVATGAVEEDVTAQATGTVDFTDVDLTDVHLVTSAAVSSDYAVPLGTFTAVKTADTTGSGTGGVASWTYDIDQAAAQQLAAGQVVTEVHRITIDDQQGDTVTQDVTVTIAGTNDDVLVSGAVATGAVEEDVTAQATGTVDFTDVDLTDVHLVTSAAVSSDYAVPLGTFTAVKTADTTGSGTGGVASWTYDIDQAAAQQLAARQVVTEVHRITIDDQQGDTVTQDVTVTIAGTNDDVLVSGAVATGAVEEDVTAQATGTVDFTDVDLTDVHLVTSAAVSSDYAVPLGTFTAVKTADTTGSGTGGVASWTYDIDQAAAQQLAARQVVTEVHRITIDDQQGDTVTQDVTVTITGTNDAPTLEAGTLTVSEDAASGISGGSDILTDSYASTLSDWLDLGDVTFNNVFTKITGATSQDWHNAVDGTGATVTVMTLDNGNTIGGYNPFSWNTSSSYTRAFDTDAFLFNLTTGNMYEHSRYDYVTYNHLNYGPTFGGGHDLYVNSTLSAGYTNLGFTYGDPTRYGTTAYRNEFAGSYNSWQIIELETFTIQTGGTLATLDLSTLGDDIDSDDTGTTLTYSVSGVPSAGTASIDGATLTYSPGSAFQNLKTGESGTVTISVTATDVHGASVENDVTVVIEGRDDVARIGGSSDGTVTEDTATTTSGALTVFDPDAGEQAFQAGNVSGAYGDVTLNSAGAWTYYLDNDLASVQALNTGQFLTDTVTVRTIDGTTEDITIRINGVTDVAQQLATTYNIGTAAGSSFGSAYNLTNLNYQKTLDPDIGNPTENPSVTISARGTPGQWDTYRLDVAQNGTLVAFDIDYGRNSGVSFDPWINLYTSSGYRIAYNDDSPVGTGGGGSAHSYDSYLSRYLNAGTYFLRVGNYHDRPFYNDGTYQLQVSVKRPVGDPIVLDLDGDGFDLTSSITFDLDVDGHAESLSWTSAGDGVLAVDRDRSGMIEDGTEVLSEAFDGLDFTNSMEALRYLDQNADGVVDAADASFLDLLVWRDLDGDGVSDAGELALVRDLGITSISVGAEVGQTVIDGQTILEAGTIEFADGRVHEHVAVAFGAFVPEGRQFDVTRAGEPVSIEGFVSGVDQLVFQETLLTDDAGGLVKFNLTEGTAAIGAEAQFVYDQSSGSLAWDADGESGANAVSVAILEAGTVLTEDDFMMI